MTHIIIQLLKKRSQFFFFMRRIAKSDNDHTDSINHRGSFGKKSATHFLKVSSKVSLAL